MNGTHGDDEIAASVWPSLVSVTETSTRSAGRPLHRVRLGSDCILYRQSKLSPTQLDELQRATHFDKKELQQWYKGGLRLVSMT